MNEFQKAFDIDSIYIKNSIREETYNKKDILNELKVISWNIGRGYICDEIITYIKEINPDVLLLQEVDWNNDRTLNKDIAQEVCDELGFQGVYAIEFFELNSIFRGNKRRGGGVHGNVIISRFPINNARRIALPEIYSWNKPRNPLYLSAFLEKRKGGRCALAASIEVNGEDIDFITTHFEDKAGGAEGRFFQFTELMKHFKQISKPLIIGSDFNTHANLFSVVFGIERKRGLRQRNIILPECAWWKSYVLPPLNLFEQHKCNETTFSLGPFSWKLDWLLSRSIPTINSYVGKSKASDHKPLIATYKIKE